MLRKNIEDLKLPKLKIEKIRKIRKINRIFFKGIILGLVSILFVGILYSLFIPTTENVLVSGARKVLASVGVYTEEVKSVEIKSEEYDKQEGGSWHIDKSADWIGLNKAQIKFDLDTVVKTGEHFKDIIFVLDVSGSMEGEKLERVKVDAKELINVILSNSNNKVSIITFDSYSSILAEFTNDINKLTKMIDELDVDGCTNYNIALSNVDKVMENYKKESGRDAVILFMTDGYPNEDIPNQIATYNILKEKYPYITINGIQYEMGKNIIKDIIDISDNQYIADMESLNNVLFTASESADYYDSFEIVDYIDKNYWYVESESDIKVDKGHVRLEEENGGQKVIWSFGAEEFRTGENAELTIDVKLKDQYVGLKGFYPTNEKEIISYKLPDEDEVNSISSKTPVLKSGYRVTYESNTPSKCKIDINDSTIHYAFESVTKRNDQLTCDGYIFNGWEIVNQGVKKVNDDVFIMPSEDVTIRGIWTKPLIAKSMDGEVIVRATLYNKIREESVSSPDKVKKYTGPTDTFIGDKDVYYYYGGANSNNVLFGNYCWKIVRTTDTGGVKLLYNGVPSESGTCNNSGNNSALTKNMMGTKNLNVAFNSSISSPAYVGYMYNTIYTYNSKTLTKSKTILYVGYMSSSSSYNYYYSDTYDYRDGKYYLYKDDPNSVTKTPWIETSIDEEGNTITKNNYENFVGKYTCGSSSDSLTYSSSGRYCSNLYYILKTDENYMYYIILSEGNDVGDKGYEETITFGQDVKDNNDGTFTLLSPVTIEKVNWNTDYSNYKGYYTCGNNELICSSMIYITSTSNSTVTYFDRKPYKYANSFIYDSDTSQYILVNTDDSPIKEIFNWASEYNTLGKNHYTCWNNSGICSEISYIYYISSKEPFYIKLTGGKSADEALNEMLYNDNVNTKDSTIKAAIDYWYANNMTNYTEYLEDTYWCNDRSMLNQGINGWSANGSLDNNLKFLSSNNIDNNLTCVNKNDRFTVDGSNGNGALKYPVGLITRQEQGLAYTYASPLASGNTFWTMSPHNFSSRFTDGFKVIYDGNWNTEYVSNSHNVRPSVSLRSSIEYISGDGSVDKPYIIDMSSE